jgi:hypothetical protein
MACAALIYHDVHKDNLLYHCKLKDFHYKIEILFFVNETYHILQD